MLGNRPAGLLLALLFALSTGALSGCHRDLIIDAGNGDSIRLEGAAANFDCDDPAHASVKKIKTFELRFADGTTQSLCRAETSSSVK